MTNDPNNLFPQKGLFTCWSMVMSYSTFYYSNQCLKWSNIWKKRGLFGLIVLVRWRGRTCSVDGLPAVRVTGSSEHPRAGNRECFSGLIPFLAKSSGFTHQGSTLMTICKPVSSKSLTSKPHCGIPTLLKSLNGNGISMQEPLGNTLQPCAKQQLSPAFRVLGWWKGSPN